MPIFKFKAEKSGGEIYEGKRNAADKFILYQDLKREGETVVSAQEVHNKRSFGFSLDIILARVSTRDKILFARNLGNMLEAGLSLARALSVMERQTNNKGLKDIINKVAAEISRGQSLSEALKHFPKVFSTLFVSMVYAGEESGSLPDALKTVATQMSNTYQLQKKIRGAMIYPAIIVCVIIIIGILMLIYVVPTLTAVFSDLAVELPWNTRLIITASGLLKDHTVMALGFLAVFGFLFSWIRQTAAGKHIIELVILRIPLINTLVREFNSARTARTLSSLLSSGVEVVQSLEITADVVQNSYFRSVLEQAQERIKKGESLSSVFNKHTDRYPIFVSEMISIGEETGKLAGALGNVADYYEEEVSQKTKDLSVIIEPALMILVGCAVAFFALSVLSPMYSLVNVI